MASYTELYIDRGASFEDIITLTDDITGQTLNIAGYSIYSQIKRSYYTANVAANLVCNITDAANGVVSISLDSANTSNLKTGRYVFDVLMNDTNNKKTRLVEGIVTVTPQVTIP